MWAVTSLTLHWVSWALPCLALFALSLSAYETWRMSRKAKPLKFEILARQSRAWKDTLTFNLSPMRSSDEENSVDTVNRPAFGLRRT
jgi:hypothetical protein